MWYFTAWMFSREVPDEPTVTYCLGLLGGNVWDVALLCVLFGLFFIQLWRLWPVIRAQLRA